MRSCVLVTLCAAALLVVATPAGASQPTSGDAVFVSLFDGSAAAKKDPWRVTFEPADVAAVQPSASSALDDGQQARPRVVATEYSDAYKVRARIHRMASFAMLPLFGTELYLGQSVYNGSVGGKRSAHIAVGAAIGTLFAVNSVTGVWNMWEGRKDPNNRTLRLVHGLLMLAADAGFFATAATGPSSEHEYEYGDYSNFSNRRATHRAVALTSIGLGTAGYLIMLFGGR